MRTGPGDRRADSGRRRPVGAVTFAPEDPPSEGPRPGEAGLPPPPGSDDWAPLEEALRDWFDRQFQALTAYLKGLDKAPAALSVDHWTDDMAAGLSAKLAPHWAVGGKGFLVAAGLDPETFRVVDPHVRAAINSAAFAFCRATNEATSLELADALSALRDALAAGLIEEGDGPRKLQARVQEIFDRATDLRAARIAESESSRALHAAAMMSAERSGVASGTRWLASGDACSKCLRLAAESADEPVPLGGLYGTFGTNEHYKDVRYPPAHVGCQCSMTVVLKDADPMPQPEFSRYAAFSAAAAKLSGGVWRTINHAKVYIKGGRVAAGMGGNGGSISLKKVDYHPAPAGGGKGGAGGGDKAAAKPEAAGKGGRGTDERGEHARKILRERAQGNYGTARSLKEQGPAYERIKQEARAKLVNRNKKNVAILKDYLAKGGVAHVMSRTAAIKYTKPEHVVGVDERSGMIQALDKGRSGKTIGIFPRTEQEAALLGPARKARADELRAQRQAAQSKSSPAKPSPPQAKPAAQPKPAEHARGDKAPAKPAPMPDKGKPAAKPPEKPADKAGPPQAKAAEKDSKPDQPFSLDSGKARDQSTLKDKLKDPGPAPAREAHPERKAGYLGEVATKDIHFDPARFQYKMAQTDTHTGSVGSLAGVKKWDPELAGVVSVWKDPKDNKTYVVNGHNRLDLANKLGVDKVAVRYLDAPNAGWARAKGALANIAEGRGTSLDAAKFFRDSGIKDKAALQDRGIPLGESKTAEGLALAGLAHPLFRRAIDGTLPTDKAAIIGGGGLADHQQMQLAALYDKQKGKVTGHQLREWVDESKAAGDRKKDSGPGLFGPEDHDHESLFLHRTALNAHVTERLSREKKLFGTVARKRSADELTRGGNVIDAHASGKISQDAAEALNVFGMLKRTSVFAGATNEATRLMAEAKNDRERAKVRDDYYAEVKRRVRDAYNLAR